MIAGYQSDRLADIHTTEAAWRTFVGASTPQEFLMYSQEANARDAVSAYVGELPNALGHEYTRKKSKPSPACSSHTSARPIAINRAVAGWRANRRETDVGWSVLARTRDFR